MQTLGLAAWPAALLLIAFGLARAVGDALGQRLTPTPLKALAATGSVLALSAALSAPGAPAAWPLATGLGGLWGDGVTGLFAAGVAALRMPGGRWIAGLLFLLAGLWAGGYAVGLRIADLADALHWGRSLRRAPTPTRAEEPPAPKAVRKPKPRPAPVLEPALDDDALSVSREATAEAHADTAVRRAGRVAGATRSWGVPRSRSGAGAG